MKFTYLLVDLFAVVIPIVFSFHPRIRFYKIWAAFFPAMIIVAALFIMGDFYFTERGIWGFNTDYITGIFVGNLPIEEVLFFLCIPYACVFTFFCLEPYLAVSNTRSEKIWTTVFICLLFAIGLANLYRAYSSFAFFGLAIALTIARFIIKVNWLGKFYMVYMVLLLPFAFVNGILTGTGLDNPVVWYNNNEILRIRFATIPVEDIFYGMNLVLLNIVLCKQFLRRKERHNERAVLEGA